MKFVTTFASRLVAMVGFASVPLGLLLVCASVASAGGPPPPGSVPEVDPGSLASVLALIAGGTVILRSRLRR